MANDKSGEIHLWQSGEWDHIAECDPACQDLAEHVLRHEPYIDATTTLHEQRVRNLAQHIQEAINEWIADNV